MAYDEKRLSWNVQANEMCEDHFSATFDGAESRLLMENSLLDKVDKPCLGELIIDSAPHDAVTCSARQTAFWFAFNPLAWLERQAYQLDSMRIIDTRSVCQRPQLPPNLRLSQESSMGVVGIRRSCA